jgi:AraC family transcriptional regulator
MVLRIAHGGGASRILHERAAVFSGGTQAGALSVKSMANGTARYESERRHCEVGPDSYLILNDGQPYAISIDADQPVESFCVFFNAAFAGDVFRSLTSGEAELLDEPVCPNRSGVRFFDRLYAHDGLVSPVLARMRAESTVGCLDAGRAEEWLHVLLERMLAVHHAVRADVDSLPAHRSSTRQELYRRLHHARDYMETRLAEPTSIAEIAAVAAMAPHHFIRQFKQLFGDTPHQYLKRRRLDRAGRLVAETDMPITEVGLEVGFESLGTFSWLFRKRFGMAPQHYRASLRGTPCGQIGSFEEAGNRRCGQNGSR